MRPKMTLVAIAAVLAALLAGCGSSDKKSSSSSSGSTGSSGATAPAAAKVDPAVAKLVPPDVKSKGSLTVATDPTYPPNEFPVPGGTQIQGMDIDLARALGGVMGVKVNPVKSTFDAIIPGLAAHKYDFAMSSFTDNKEREKTVDFVTYFSAGTSFFTKAQGGTTVNGLADLCGHKVAVEKGTTQATEAATQGKKCRAAGKPAVTVLVFPGQDGANLALSSGRADVSMADSPVALYNVKKSAGQFKAVGQTYGTAPYGIAVPKKSGLAPPVKAALEKLIAGGQYKQILGKWGVEAGAIAKPQINGATS